RRELQEELGIVLPKDAFELLFSFLEERVTNNGTFINNEFNDVYLVTTAEPIPLKAFTLQESEVSAVKYIPFMEYKRLLENEDPHYVPYNLEGQYGQLFVILLSRYDEDAESRSRALQERLNQYAIVPFDVELTGLTNEDKESLSLLIKAAEVMNEIFFQQVWHSNPCIRDWLEVHANESQLSKSKWLYYLINKSPWSILNENEAFLTTADSPLKLFPNATKRVEGWRGLEYRAAFPVDKPAGANFYPPDMDKLEFELWKNSLSGGEKEKARSFFSVIKRESERLLDESTPATATGSSKNPHDLFCVPYSEEYRALLTKASDLMNEAADLTTSSSLKKFLKSRADAFLSNDYYDSDIAWMELDSLLDVTIGPYETYEDRLFGYKATFEAFIGIRDDEATSALHFFRDKLQFLEDNLPMDDVFKSKNVVAAPIRVIRLIYNAGDVKGPQTVAFNLPNDERIVKDRGTSVVMLKNVAEAKFDLILRPIAKVFLSHGQERFVNFHAFFFHIICHEYCHGIGPHTIVLPDGKESTVRLELQELHAPLEEAKADIVGLWALRFLSDKNLIPELTMECAYVS
ncbi:hypothetical protein M569_14749, partial [Genlisea aurea]